MNESPIRHQVTLQTIRSKRNELLSTAAKYEALAAKARAEAADYEAAERVWLKLLPEQEGEGSGIRMKPPPATLSIDSDKALVSIGGGPFVSTSSLAVPRSKPTEIPSVPDMIIEALTEANDRLNVDSLTPSAILSFVQQKYWPDAKSADVGSTAWRMWKDGRLTRPQEGLYGLPNGRSSHPNLLEQVGTQDRG